MAEKLTLKKLSGEMEALRTRLQELELDVDASVPDEQDLIEFLRLYAESLEGPFPPELTMRVTTDIALTHGGDLAAVMGPGMKAGRKGIRALQFVEGLGVVSGPSGMVARVCGVGLVVLLALTGVTYVWRGLGWRILRDRT